MRKPVKYRLAFLVLMLVTYYLGFQLMPESLQTSQDKWWFFTLAASYFLLLPVFYWLWVIKIGQQKLWKMLIILSLSSLMARLSFPAEFAHYFEFIAWLRYPIIAVLLVLELALMASIIKGLWQARKAKGDPRVKLLHREAIAEKSELDKEAPRAGEPKMDDKAQAKLSLGLTFAYEPTSWYYALPWLTRKHVKSIANIRLLAAKPWHWLMMAVVTLSLAVASYMLLVDWSEITAILLSSFILYCLIYITANYRASRHFSLYVHEQHLVINNSLWGLMLVPLEQISYVKFGLWHKADDKEQLQFGFGKTANLELGFKQAQTYYGAFGQLTEKWDKVRLNLYDPQALMTAVSQYQSADGKGFEHQESSSHSEHLSHNHSATIRNKAVGE